MSQTYDAIEITAPKVWEVICALDPTWKDVPYEDAHEAFFVLNLPEGGSSLVPATAFGPDDEIAAGMNIKLARCTIA